jgi:8-oxo-dGTP diphosphatase
MKVSPATARQFGEFVDWLPVSAQRDAAVQAHNASTVWLAHDGAGLVGGALIRPGADQSRLHVQRLMLAPVRQGRGLGRALLGALENYARESGFERMCRDCLADDAGLASWYQGAGYFSVGEAGMPNLQLLRLEKDLAAARCLEQMFVTWEPDLTGTLLFVLDGDQVLLIDKKTGHGAGKINAPGGKMEPGETPMACAIRETIEEVGVHVESPRLMARLKFADPNAPQWYGYAFVAHGYSGTPVETREARPRWCSLDAIPYDLMWPDDRIWLPRVLAGQGVSGEFLFDDGELVAHRVSELAV